MEAKVVKNMANKCANAKVKLAENRHLPEAVFLKAIGVRTGF